MGLTLDDMENAFAAMEAQGNEYAAKREEWRKTMVGRFNPYNLMHWISLCERASVPHVPARVVANAKVDDIVNYDNEAGNTPEARAFWDAVQKHISRGRPLDAPPEMLRWSCCSCAVVKERLGNGEPGWHDDLLDFRIDDFRAFDLVADYNEERIDAIARPWWRFAIHRGYPVEFRVFVEDDTVKGVSNYYPQRSLLRSYESDNFERFAARAAELAGILIENQTTPINCPLAERHGLDTKLNCWTADFALKADWRREPKEALVFLEGGPGHFPTGGAHGCCFAPLDISGIAMAIRPGAPYFDEFGNNSEPLPTPPNDASS